MKGKKTSDEVIAKVIEEKINTNGQGSEIARKLGLNGRTVRHIIDTELAKACQNSKSVSDLIDINDNLQSMADQMIADLIKAKDDKITIAQLTSLRDSTFKQNQLLKGENTENQSITIQWEA